MGAVDDGSARHGAKGVRAAAEVENADAVHRGAGVDAGEQLGLELWAREYDLPPRWDGLIAEWGDWDDTGRMFICPAPKNASRCAQCGSFRPALICTGRLWTDPKTAPRAIGRARMRGGRHLVGLISALRCPDCEHDTVTDPNGQEWDLDETDYTAAGSVAP